MHLKIEIVMFHFNKILAVILLFIMICIFGGCVSNAEVSNIYEIKSEIFEDKDFKDGKNITIEYPQIITKSEAIDADKVNIIIKSAALNDYDEKWDVTGLNISQSYTIGLKNDNLLSIVFYRSLYVERTAHPTDECFAVTINLKEAEIYSLIDFIKPYEELEQSLLNSNYEVIYGGAKAMTLEEILILVQSKYNDIDINKHIHDFYIDENKKVCIIIEMPHAAGDYAIICIDDC